jgi:dolichyl-diphosphooligosaccharide--protein glycosyltransferase
MSVAGRLRAALSGVTLPSVTAERLALSLAVGLVAAVRSLPVAAVFRPGGVVLSSNDPYYYRHHVERLVTESGGPLGLGVGPAVRGAGDTGEPLTVAVLWAASELAGGSATAAGWVLAWYPVLTAVLAALLVYHAAVVLTADRRVGLAAVCVFAVVPGHAFRTGVGFADHHAMDYLLLALTLAALVELAGPDTGGTDDAGGRERTRAGATGHDRRDRRRLLAVALAVGVGGGVLAWEAGGLLLVPAAAGTVPVAAVAARRGRPVDGLGPVVVGYGLATVAAGGGYALLGWGVASTVVAPLLLLCGAVGLTGLAVAVTRLDSPYPGAAVLVGSVTGGGVAALAGIAVARTGAVGGEVVFDRLRTGVAFLTGAGGIAETASLGSGFGPVFGPLVMLGFAPVVGGPALVWGLWRALDRGEAGWAVLVSYVVYFLGLALLQRRFVGELAAPLAVAGGVGLVGLLGWLDLLRRPAPAMQTADTGDAGRTGLGTPERGRGLVLGLFGATVVGFPAAYTAETHRRVTVERAPYAAARFMRRYAAERGWSSPRNYVLSRWGRNRLYNYVVSGESASYEFARETYLDFLTAGDAAAWYDRLRGRVGFVVTTATPPGRADRIGTVHELLHRRWGADRRDGAGHYRGVFATAGGRVKVFTLVPGARVVGRVSTGEQQGEDTDTDTGRTSEVCPSTVVTVPGARFTYERPTRTDTTGRFAVRVAHPGEYRVAGRRVTVTERAVREGRTVVVDADAPGE